MYRQLLVGYLVFLVTGCSAPVKLHPPVPDPPNCAKLQKSVGIYHSEKFLAYEKSDVQYANQFEVDYPLGEASNDLLLNTYPYIFERWQRLTSMPSGAEGNRTFDAFLQPDIESFLFYSGSAEGPFWAEILYTFTLYENNGTALYSWKVKGWSENPDEKGDPIRSVPEKAMSNAAIKFANSFQEVPELRRWSLGLPLENTSVPQSGQKTSEIAEFGGLTQEGSYEGVVRVRARFPAVKTEDTRQRDSGPASIHLLVKNEGERKIRVDPTAFRFTTTEGKEFEPISSSFAASMLITRYTRLPPIAPGIGLAAIPGLIVALANAAEDMAERKELRERLAILKRDTLRETVLSKGESIEGLVFFPMQVCPPKAGEIKVPIVPFGSTERYIVKLSLIP